MLKILQLVLDLAVELILEDLCLSSGYSAYLNLIINLSTLGANTFYVFVLSYFVDVSSQILERLYILIAWDSIVEYMEERLEHL